MSRELVIDNHTRLAQSRASTPENSAWVSANAGSGKTFVLARRVVRLLLSGVEPSRILCLTYTKAAAGEMSNRVFDILGNWVGASDEAMREELTDVEGRPPSSAQLKRARVLFARALETPGGLKIQTIHAFCEALLHQFPLEANVPGTFKVMDDLVQRQLMERARQAIALTAHSASAAHNHPENEVGNAFIQLMDIATDLQIDRAFGEIVDQREELAKWLVDIGGPVGATGHARKLMGFSASDCVENMTEQAVQASHFHYLNCDQIAEFAIATGAAQSVEFGENLRAFGQSHSLEDKVQAISSLLLIKSGAPRKFNKYPANAIEEKFSGLRADLAAESDRWLAALSRIKTLRLIENTQPLLFIAQAMIEFYAQAKRQRGLLDFDDLIERTADLLARGDARAWVLYKLDLGIDHVLLDEAQDTSPKQWQIISALVEEFFSGQSARQATRTVFAVGDEKQSIYSFRGAVPENFARQRRHYVTQARAANLKFEEVALDLSFRSTTDVLGAVDAVFSFDDHAQGVTFDAPPPAHTAARRNDPGCVDVWDMIVASPGDDPEFWHTPIDFSGQHQALILADRIADQLKDWIGNKTLKSSGKPIAAGDILVLVRSRDRFVGALNRALKARNISVSGADRLTITDHIAVQDLMAAGQVTLTPQDDLSLAAVLKSPLIGLGEEDLFDLSQFRLQGTFEISLFEALQTNPESRFSQAFETIERWRNSSDRVPVYEFYAQMLGTLGGRQSFLARLGAEAEDVIDAFLDAALVHEQGETPGLQAFLDALMEEKPEIKREMDRTAGEVRIMTVHAAKGLEAPIVFLVDKSSPAFQVQHAPALYHWQATDQDPCYLWVPASADHCTKTLELREVEKRRAEEEYRRLLYVGMTRAEDRLIVCGYQGSRKPSSPNWHAMVCRALEPNWEDEFDPDGNLLWHRWIAEDSPPPRHLEKTDSSSDSAADQTVLPSWIFHKLPPEKSLPRPLNPSGTQAIIDEALAQQPALHSPFDIPNPDTNLPDPRIRGTVLHKLLQVLPDIPEPKRWSMAANYLKKQLAEYSTDSRDAMIVSLKNVFSHAKLRACFDPSTSRGEVALMGTIMGKKGERSVSGQIDRLAVLDDRVLVLDYKTNGQVPETHHQIPPDYITQMALYRVLVARLYPDKQIYCALIWTQGSDSQMVMELEDSAMEAALAQIAQL